MSSSNSLPDDLQELATRLMASAQAHQFASVHCSARLNVKEVDLKSVFLNVVSVELILLAIEQSFRLLSLLCTKQFSGPGTHLLWSVYKETLRKEGIPKEMKNDIVSTMNEIGDPLEIKPFFVKELEECLKKHDTSYSDIRYFMVDRKGKPGPELTIDAREKTVLIFLALALIAINLFIMKEQGIAIIDSSSLEVLPETQ